MESTHIETEGSAGNELRVLVAFVNENWQKAAKKRAEKSAKRWAWRFVFFFSAAIIAVFIISVLGGLAGIRGWSLAILLLLTNLLSLSFVFQCYKDRMSKIELRTTQTAMEELAGVKLDPPEHAIFDKLIYALHEVRGKEKGARAHLKNVLEEVSLSPTISQLKFAREARDLITKKSPLT